VTIELSLPDHLVGNGFAQIRAGGCAPHDLLVEPNGRIRGRVLLPDHHPAGGSVKADKNGEYEFSALPPGEYLVRVSLTGPPNNGAPFPATYYPGTMRRQDARADRRRSR
jgi:hypothetical protein